MELTIELTDFCHNNCIHCSSSASRDGCTFLEMKRIREVITQVKPARVILSGGEPMIYPYLTKLCKFLHKKKISISMNTCGVFSYHIDFKFTKWIDTFYVTLLHAENEKYTCFSPPGNKWMLVPTYYTNRGKKARNALQLLKQLGKGTHVMKPINPHEFLHDPLQVMLSLRRGGKKVIINTPVFDHNQAESIVEVAYIMEFPVHFIRLLPRGRGARYEILPFEEQKRIAEEMLDQLDPSRIETRMPPFLARDGYNQAIFCAIEKECKAKLEKIFPDCKVSHSLQEKTCRARTKRTILKSGVLIGCVAGKGVDERLDIIKVCNKKCP